MSMIEYFNVFLEEIVFFDFKFDLNAGNIANEYYSTNDKVIFGNF